jgi:hypothetical protein
MPKSLKPRPSRTDVVCMFLPISVVPSVSEAAIQALCPSLNTPVLNIEQLPVGPARAAILLFEGEYGEVYLAVGLRSLETNEVMAFSYQGDPHEFSSTSSAVGTALSFAEGMGFLFEDDLIAQEGAEGRRLAAQTWESLVRESQAELALDEAAAGAYEEVGAYGEVEACGEEELDLVDLASNRSEPAGDGPSAELLLEATDEAPDEFDEPDHGVEDHDAEALVVSIDQALILTKFRGSAAQTPPSVSREARTALGRIPLVSVPVGVERKPRLLARLLGSF